MRFAVIASLLIYVIFGLFNHENFSFLNGVNLLFHEAGHVFFAFLGEYPGIWGGTLMQLIIPLSLAGIFMRRGDNYAASIMTAWTGQNLIHISDYMKDARAQVLPYVGGEIHDWHYIFSRAGILDHDQLIGAIVCGAAAFFTILVLATGSMAAFFAMLPRRGPQTPQ